MWTPKTVANQKQVMLEPTYSVTHIIRFKARACIVTDAITVELDPHTVSG